VTQAKSSAAVPLSTYDVLGIPITVTSLDSASRTITAWAGDRCGRFVCIRDVHGVMQARADAAVMAVHREAAMVTPDGMPLVWIGRRRGLPVERTCGPDLIDRVLGDSVKSGLGHYFYGGKPGVAARLAEGFAAKYSGLKVVAAESAPFTDLDREALAALAARIEASAADVVWIGLSTPRQELLMQRLAPLVGATLIGVGAAFDFHTGAVKRAPQWMQKAGLEWSFRLLSEPRRLWRRYLIMAPRFLIALAREKLR